MNRFLLFIIPFFLLLGCQHKVVRTATGLDSKKFWSEQEKRAAAFHSYSAKINLRYQGKEESISGKGNVLVDGTRGVRMELRDPLGRLQYVLTSKKDLVTALYPREGLAYSDTQKGIKYFEHMLGLALTVDDLRLLWLGILNSSAHLSSFEWSEADADYVASVSQNGSDYHLEINPDTAAIMKLNVKKGSSTFQVSYAEFEGERGISLAHEVQFESKDQGTKIEVEWDKFQTFPVDAPSNLFDAEENAKIRKLILK